MNKEILFTVCYLGAIPGIILGANGITMGMIAEALWLAMTLTIPSIRNGLKSLHQLVAFAAYINVSVAFVAYYRVAEGSYIDVAIMAWLLVLFIALARSCRSKQFQPANQRDRPVLTHCGH